MKNLLTYLRQNTLGNSVYIPKTYPEDQTQIKTPNNLMNRKISAVLNTAKNEFRQKLKMIQTMTVCDTLRKQMVLF
jgi:hypothetical protein